MTCWGKKALHALAVGMEGILEGALEDKDHQWKAGGCRGQGTPGLAKCVPRGEGTAVQHSSQLAARSSQEQTLGQQEPLCGWPTRPL